MEMKRNWTLFLRNIMLKISLLCCFSGCLVHKIVDYVYVNGSDYNVTIVIARLDEKIRRYSIPSRASLRTHEYMITPLFGDTVAKIIFNNDRMIIQSNSDYEDLNCNIKNSLYCKKSYIKKRVKKYYTQQIYTLTNEDYQRAESCEGDCE